MTQSERPYVAVASMEGILVNQHLGEATRLWIFEATDGEPKLVELRYTPEAGGGNQRWRDLAESINDCHAVVVSGVGRTPRWVLVILYSELVIFDKRIRVDRSHLDRDILQSLVSLLRSDNNFI